MIFQRSLSTSFCDTRMPYTIETVCKPESPFFPHVMSKPFHVSWAVQPSGSKSIRTTCQPSDDEKLEALSCSGIPFRTKDQNLPSQNNGIISKSWLSNLSTLHLPKRTLWNLHRQQPSPAPAGEFLQRTTDLHLLQLGSEACI